jgi:hypothetical protein
MDEFFFVIVVVVISSMSYPVKATTSRKNRKNINLGCFLVICNRTVFGFGTSKPVVLTNLPVLLTDKRSNRFLTISFLKFKFQSVFLVFTVKPLPSGFGPKIDILMLECSAAGASGPKIDILILECSAAGASSPVLIDRTFVAAAAWPHRFRNTALKPCVLPS